MLGIVEHGILPWGNALDGLLALDEVAFLGVIAQETLGELGGMTHLEGDLQWSLTAEGSLEPLMKAGVGPWVKADEVALLHADVIAVLVGGVIALADEEDIATDVLLHDEPWPATEPQPLALTDGVEPVATMLAEYLARLTLDDEPLTLAESSLDELVVVHLPEEADPLAVLASSAQQMDFLGDLAYLTLEQVPCGEEELGDLTEVDLGEEVRLILHGVGGGR